MPPPFPQGEVDPETGEPTGNIHEGVVDLVATAGGRRYTTASELLDAEDEGVSQAIVDGITKYNQEHAPSYNQKVGVALAPDVCMCMCVCCPFSIGSPPPCRY